MRSENKRTISLFIIIIFLFILLFIYNDYKNRDLNILDRKVNYFFNHYTYNDIIVNGNNLFSDAIKILNINNLEYEKNNTNGIKYYSINGYDEYKKIVNFNIISRTLNNKDIIEYFSNKKIINVNNTYYIENYIDLVNKDYVGSIIEISHYDDNNIYFKSKNYYCKNYEHIGLLEKTPDCEYQETETSFYLIYEDETLKIGNINDIKKIIE